MATAKRKYTQRQKYECVNCHEEKVGTDYYISHSPMFSVTKKMPICKQCLNEQSIDEDGNIDLIKFEEILQRVDRPYIQKALDAAIKENEKYPCNDKAAHSIRVLGTYWRSLQSLPQYKFLTYKDSNKFDAPSPIDVENIKVVSHKSVNTKKAETKVQVDVTDFELTPEIISLFGDGYTISEYKKMNDKYEELKKTYSIQTSLHKEALVTYVRFKVKEEMATAAGNVVEAQKWYSAAQDAAEKAKLTPKQLTEADLHGGINSFSEIFKAVEQAVDVVPILPSFKYRPNDALDFVIWCYVNYIRNLQGMPECDYEDVYKFYDRKKEEYISQYGDPYGIFDDDPSESLRDSIKKFITLPKDYVDEDKL